MIDVRVGELASVKTIALLRPVAADWSAVTPAMRRLELAAGPEMTKQCLRLGELPVGSAAITGAGELPADFMVHVVIRSRDEPVSRSSVSRALLNGLRRLTEWAIDSVALAPLGTGAGNLDAEVAAAAMAPVLLEQLRDASRPLRITLVVDNEYEREAFERALGGVPPHSAGSPPVVPSAD